MLPFVAPEPSLGIGMARVTWHPQEPTEPGQRFRAALEALAYLIARGVREHEVAGQKITRITVSGGIAAQRLGVRDFGERVTGSGRWNALYRRSRVRRHGTRR